ncbi:hypothetical protein D3C84_1304230 [compost metagenome]
MLAARRPFTVVVSFWLGRGPSRKAGERYLALVEEAIRRAVPGLELATHLHEDGA